MTTKRGNFASTTWMHLDQDVLTCVQTVAARLKCSEGGAIKEIIRWAMEHGFRADGRKEDA